jgi:hypothetical protein
LLLLLLMMMMMMMTMILECLGQVWIANRDKPGMMMLLLMTMMIDKNVLMKKTDVALDVEKR